MASGRHLAFVGCLNRAAPYFPAPQGRGIAVFSFDAQTGALDLLSETEGVDNPTFLTFSQDGRALFATSEVYGWHEGVVTAYAIGADGRLTYINKQSTRGSVAAQASVDPSGRWLLVANYRMGEDGIRPHQAVVTFPIEPDGGLGPAADGVVHLGSGPKPDRQEGPHPHCVLASPDGSHVFVADLGIDRIIAYRLDAGSGRLSRAHDVALPAGSGPRHVTWARPGLLVATGELDNTVTSLAWDGSELRVVASVSMLPVGFSGESHAADIHVSPDGRFVYASNRGHDSIAVLSIDAGGKLSLIANQSTGRTPRNFVLDPSGNFVLIACQDGNEVTVHRRDSETGLLSGPGGRATVGSPMCVRFSPR